MSMAGSGASRLHGAVILAALLAGCLNSETAITTEADTGSTGTTAVVTTTGVTTGTPTSSGETTGTGSSSTDGVTSTMSIPSSPKPGP